MIRNCARAVAAAVLSALAAGCCKAPPPPIVEAEGFVRLEGRPIYKAAVRFVPEIEYGPEYTAVGVTDEMGHFKLTCKGRPGACAVPQQGAGDGRRHPARIPGRERPGGAGPVSAVVGRRPPAQYGNLVESPLSAAVKAGRTEYDFDLAP